MSEDFRKESRKSWISNDGGKPTNEQLQLGCLQRIADSTEVMSQNYVQLQKDRDWYKDAYNKQVEKSEGLERTIRTLKGHITRLKNKHI